MQFYFDSNMPFMAVLDEYVDYDTLTNNVKRRLLSLRDGLRAVEEQSIADEFPALFKSIADIVLAKYQDGSSLAHLETVLQSEKMTGTYKPLKENEVVIMTLHKAKGLEFDIVYHLNMNEFEIPFKSFENGKAVYPNEEQDLDLHYVGITRARKLCVLVTNSIRHNNKEESKTSEPSVFLYRNGVEKLRENFSY